MNEKLDQEQIKKRLKKEKKKGSRLIMITAEERGRDRYLVYHLDTGSEEGIVNLEVELNGNKADRITGIYENADLYEREAREMFGLDFGDTMRNLFLPEEAEEPPMSVVEKAIKSEGTERPNQEGGHGDA